MVELQNEITRLTELVHRLKDELDQFRALAPDMRYSPKAKCLYYPNECGAEAFSINRMADEI